MATNTAGAEILSIHELAQALAGRVNLTDATDVMARHLNRLIPSSLCVFYLHDYVADDLVARHAIGADGSALAGVRIPVGQRLSGWVAANRQTILNSDPALDFSDKTSSFRNTLRSCLSTPLVTEGRLVGVLSLYSTNINGFSEEHRRIVEVLSHQIAVTLKRASEFDNALRTDPVTGLPNVTQLQRLIGTDSSDSGFGSIKYSLLFIDVLNNVDSHSSEPQLDHDEMVRQVAIRIQQSLRFADILFRNVGDRFVAFLNQLDPHTGHLIGQQICDRMRHNPIRFQSGHSFSPELSVRCISPISKDRALGALISAPVHRSESPNAQLNAPPVIH
jgi:GGDEF domain-containing protein